MKLLVVQTVHFEVDLAAFAGEHEISPKCETFGGPDCTLLSVKRTLSWSKMVLNQSLISRFIQ